MLYAAIGLSEYLNSFASIRAGALQLEGWAPTGGWQKAGMRSATEASSIDYK